MQSGGKPEPEPEAEPHHQSQIKAPPLDAIDLVLHDHFWDFFQSPEHQAGVVCTLQAPRSLQALISAVTEAGPGMGLSEGRSSARESVFSDGPVRYFNPCPGHGSAGVLVMEGQGSAVHRLPFFACQALLVPQVAQALLASDDMLECLFGFVASPGPLPTVRAGYFVNIVYMLLDSDAPRLLSFIAAGQTLQLLIMHAHNDSVSKLLCQRIDGLVPIGSDPSTAAVSWVGLLGHERSLLLLQQAGADPVRLLVERLEALWVARSSSDSCADEICALYACIAELGECWANAGDSPASSKALLQLQSDAMASAVLRPLMQVGVPVETTTRIEISALRALVKTIAACRSCSEPNEWHGTPLRSQLRLVLPTIADWIGEVASDSTSWMDTYGPDIAVGTRRYAATRLIAALCLNGDGVDWLALANCGVLLALGASMFRHPTSSLLHCEIARVANHLLSEDGNDGAIGNAMAARRALFLGPGALIECMSTAWRERDSRLAARPPAQYYPVLQLILDTATPPPAWLARSEEWGQLQQARRTPPVSSMLSQPHRLSAMPKQHSGAQRDVSSCDQIARDASLDGIVPPPLLLPEEDVGVSVDSVGHAVCNAVAPVGQVKQLAGLNVGNGAHQDHRQRSGLPPQNRIHNKHPVETLSTMRTSVQINIDGLGRNAPNATVDSMASNVGGRGKQLSPVKLPGLSLPPLRRGGSSLPPLATVAGASTSELAMLQMGKPSQPKLGNIGKSARDSQETTKSNESAGAAPPIRPIQEEPPKNEIFFVKSTAEATLGGDPLQHEATEGDATSSTEHNAPAAGTAQDPSSKACAIL